VHPVTRAPSSSLPPTQIPIIDLAAEYQSLRAPIQEALERVLASGLFILGRETQYFEQELAAYNQVTFAIGVNSGTDAILLALRALGIGPGDEVIVPAMSFIATVEPIVLLGARPVFADIDPVTYNIDAAQAAKKVTAKTKALIAVHLYGQPADMDALVSLTRTHKIALVEDMAQAISAEFDGKKVGTFGVAACLSFFPTKNLGAYGDGGAVLTSDAQMAQRLCRLREHGAAIKYQHEEVGYNSRLDELQAAILRVKLPYLDRWNHERAELAQKYTALLGDAVTVPACGPKRKHIYHLYSIQTPRRDGLRQYLSERGIATGLHYPVPLHLQTALRQFGGQKGDYPVAEQLAQRVLSLPLYPQMTLDQLQTVAMSVRDFFRTAPASR
jgi:dTDP-4-amino-4,6-dideoxygalactose transaminase